MNRILATMILVAAMLLSAPAQAGTKSSPQNESTERAIARLQSELCEAYSRADKAALDHLLASDLTFTKENGYVSNKATEIKTVRPDPPGDEMSCGDLKVRVYDNAALTTGYMELKDPESRDIVRFRYTNTWVKREGTWQVVAIQISTLPKGKY